MNSSQFHVPVLKNEVIEYLITDRSGTYIDCTLGGGGHSYTILSALNRTGQLIGIDRDEHALKFAAQRLSDFKNQFQLFHANFGELTTVANNADALQVEGILFDLGVSSYQIDNSQRGFSYLTKGPLDMRMNQGQQLTAEHIINHSSLEELISIFREYGEERYSRSIAKRIIEHRTRNRLINTEQLAKIIRDVVPNKVQIKALSRIYQAIRIKVNDELTSLSTVLGQTIPLLKKGGRLVIISYHSLEDKIVKNFLRTQANPCTCPPSFPICVCEKKSTVKILTKHVIKPSLSETKINVRSRSARLRAAEKL